MGLMGQRGGNHPAKHKLSVFLATMPKDGSVAFGMKNNEVTWQLR
jgi:hypothetical protein